MAKKTAATTRRDPTASKGADESSAPGRQFLVFRETIESIVVAFVLAFLFRTFEAEAFVIPTGSMSPSLLGQHKDVKCSECGFEFRTTASSEGEDRDRMRAMLPHVPAFQAENLKEQIASLDVVGGMCPMCRNLMPMRPDLPANALADAGIDPEQVEFQPSYPGDRILVNKYGFDFGDPERWDVVVFKYPGDGNMNYIKRLVGLPNEDLRITLGDVFVKPRDSQEEYQIARKPPEKAWAMLEIVHDSDYESTTLHEAGWPLRWAATTPDGWQQEITPSEKTVTQRFTIDAPADAPWAWLRYRHLLPSEADWRVARSLAETGEMPEDARRAGMTEAEWRRSIHPQLIRDFNAYNARLLRGYAERHGWEIVPNSGQNSGSFGSEWVGDLALDAALNVEEARGELALDVVEAGYHFRATIDLTTGKAQLRIIDGRTGEPLDKFQASGDTGISSPGDYRVRLANIDDQLLLWVDGKLVDCGNTTYDPDILFEGGRESMIPWASEGDEGDQGDLSPAGVGARGAKLAVTRLQVWRDIYYIAAKVPGDQQLWADYLPYQIEFDWNGKTYPALDDEAELFSRKDAWQRFSTRVKRDFQTKDEQLFVMGDNSPESKDCRLWMMHSPDAGLPGGSYLDQKLLIGKAISVFWPHSWGGIPGLPMLPGFPNFRDMRMVR
jgi:signal peptidase I